MRTPERPSERLAKVANERPVESQTRKPSQPRQRVTATLASGERTRLEGSGRLSAFEMLEHSGARINRALECHVVHDARGLEKTSDGYEAAFSQVDHRGINLLTAVFTL